MCYVLYTLSCYGLYDYACGYECVYMCVSLLVVFVCFCGVYLCIYINRLDVHHAGGPVSVCFLSLGVSCVASFLLEFCGLVVLFVVVVFVCLFTLHSFFLIFTSLVLVVELQRRRLGKLAALYLLYSLIFVLDNYYSSTDVVGGL